MLKTKQYAGKTFVRNKYANTKEKPIRMTEATCYVGHWCLREHVQKSNDKHASACFLA